MSILVIGLNHKTAPVEVRERLAFKEEYLPSALTTLVDRQVINEGLIVSTCNRVEVITSTTDPSQEGLDRARQFLYRFHGLPHSSIDQYLYHHTDEHAIKHIFRVAASLDSMVMGEPQILGQVKEAYTRAVEAGTVGRCLNKLMHRAFAVAKRVRTETGIATNAVSVSYVAVELAKKVFDDLKGRTAMLVGAGEMAELALRHLQSNGIARTLIVNRTPERAQRLATELGGQPVLFENLYQELTEVDIVIASTGASTHIISAAKVKPLLEARRHRPLFMVDIAVPRNIDPEVGKLDNVFAFDIDDLQAAVEANLRERDREAQQAEIIIEREVAQCVASLRTMDVGPVIGTLKQQFNEMALAEFERNRKRMGELSPDQEDVIKNMLLSLTNKFSHPLIMRLRQSAEAGIEDDVIDLYRKAYPPKGDGKE